MTKVLAGHRNFQNSTPVQSQFLAAKWDKIQYINHRQRLTEVKPQIDCNMPFTMSLKYGDISTKKSAAVAASAPLATPSKKERIRAEQEEKINEENQRLLGKMSDISKRKTTQRGRVVVKAGKQPKRFSTHLNFAHCQEMDRVNKENQRLLQKICTNEPIYSNKVFANDYGKSQMFQQSITRYPAEAVVVRGKSQKPLLENIMKE